MEMKKLKTQHYNIEKNDHKRESKREKDKWERRKMKEWRFERNLFSFLYIILYYIYIFFFHFYFWITTSSLRASFFFLCCVVSSYFFYYDILMMEYILKSFHRHLLFLPLFFSLLYLNKFDVITTFSCSQYVVYVFIYFWDHVEMLYMETVNVNSVAVYCCIMYTESITWSRVT